ncbi:hypothetical protein PLESTM_000925100 [Pleodorina starrii]|nr:hypothetical protein PLESTM_000925100 [Pleodorina starrii]
MVAGAAPPPGAAPGPGTAGRLSGAAATAGRGGCGFSGRANGGGGGGGKRVCLERQLLMGRSSWLMAVLPSGAEPATAAAPCSAGGSRSSDHDGAGGQPPGASHGLHGSGSSTAAAAAEGTGDSRAAPFVMHGVLDHPGPVHGPETLSEMVDLMMARSER